MNEKDTWLLDRRRVLYAALMSGSGAALAACAPRGDSADTPAPDDDLWAGFDTRITERTLAEAEKLFGLQFTETERRQILGGPVEVAEDGFFAEQLESLNILRSQEIPISLAPAMKFDPRLPGVSYPEQANVVNLYPEEIATVPDDAESVAFASVKQQARWMTTGQITSRELTEIYLERIERHANLLECFVTVTPDIARAQADRADRERGTG